MPGEIAYTYGVAKTVNVVRSKTMLVEVNWQEGETCDSLLATYVASASGH